VNHAGRNAAVFLDRDGTLNVEKEYLYRCEDWEWIPGAVAAIRAFNRLGLLTVVITNQAGIGRRYYQESDVATLHAHVQALLAREDARIDAFFHCPHRPATDGQAPCACRKPAPGLLLRAQRELDLDLSRSFLIGDKAIDVQAGRTVGVPSILVATGYGHRDRGLVAPEVPFVADIGEAQRWIAGSLARKAS